MCFTKGCRKARDFQFDPVPNAYHAIAVLLVVIFAVRLETSAVQLLLQKNAEIKEELRMINATLQELARRQRGIDATKNGLLPSATQDCSRC